MRLVVPVNAAEEVASLADAGADELYCGFQDAWWTQCYGDHDSATRRQGAANIASIDELKRMAALARQRGVPLHLALNTRYTEPQLDYLVQVCDAFAEAGGTGVIASDLGLFWRLRDHPRLARTLSLLAVAQNAPTLQAFRRLGVTRVILPRFIDPAQARRLLSTVPGMQAEVMAFFDKCPWVDGYCRHRHGVSYPDRHVQGGPDGLESSRGPDASHKSDGGSLHESGNAEPLYTFDTTYRTHACLGKSCDYLEPYPCGACFLQGFEEAGVGYAKLGGRGRSLEERLRALRFLKRAQSLGSDDERRALYHATFERECACYYGDFIQDRSAIEPIAIPSADHARLYVGSQTSSRVFRQCVEGLLPGESLPAAEWLPAAEEPSGMQMRVAEGSCADSMTLLVPPLSDLDLTWLRSLLPALARRFARGTHLCVNDLGALVELGRANRELDLGFQLTMGTLLARVDDSAEVARFQDASRNPARAVWGPFGEPRMLTYAPPPEELVRHWHHPSATELSAQAALAFLTSSERVPYEFDSR